MSFCQEKFLCHFQLLEDDDGANCERSDKLLAELRKQVNICDLDGTFFFCIFCCMDWKEAARKGFGCKAAPESMGLFKTPKAGVEVVLSTIRKISMNLR